MSCTRTYHYRLGDRSRDYILSTEIKLLFRCLFFANSGKFLQKNSPRTPHTKHTPNTNPQKVPTVHIIQGRNYEFLGQLEGCPLKAEVGTVCTNVSGPAVTVHSTVLRREVVLLRVLPEDSKVVGKNLCPVCSDISLYLLLFRLYWAAAALTGLSASPRERWLAALRPDRGRTVDT